MNKPPLTLFSSGLLSKWGFNDGCVAEDYCDDHDLADVGSKWDIVLRQLVRQHLLPELQKNHTIELYDIDTSHNPIRAAIVDGHEVDDHNDNPLIRLRPESVDIPMERVVDLVAQVSSTCQADEYPAPA